MAPKKTRGPVFLVGALTGALLVFVKWLMGDAVALAQDPQLSFAVFGTCVLAQAILLGIRGAPPGQRRRAIEQMLIGAGVGLVAFKIVEMLVKIARYEWG